MNLFSNAFLAAVLFILSGGVAGAQMVVLHDAFDGTKIGTNTGPAAAGNGFFLNDANGQPPDPAEATAAVAGGQVTIAGPAAVKTLVSMDALDPIGKVLTWQIAARPSGADSGVQIGWTLPNGNVCCGAGVRLEMRGDRVVFDLMSAAASASAVQISRYLEIPFGSTAPGSVYTSASSPLTATMRLQRNRWTIDIIGTGVDIHRKGFYSGCSIVHSQGQPCASPAAIFDLKRGTMHVFATAFGEGQSASFSDVTVVIPL